MLGAGHRSGAAVEIGLAGRARGGKGNASRVAGAALGCMPSFDGRRFPRSHISQFARADIGYVRRAELHV